MDMSIYMDIFRAESEKYIKEMSDSLLALEKDSDNSEQMNTLFRAAHTFKGMAATMGFKQIVKLTHEMESLIDKLRTQQLILDSSLIDVLLICVDTLEKLVENALDENENSSGKIEKDTGNEYKSYSDIDELLRTLRNVNQPLKKAPLQKDKDKPLDEDNRSLNEDESLDEDEQSLNEDESLDERYLNEDKSLDEEGSLFLEEQSNKNQNLSSIEEAALTERISEAVHQIERSTEETEKKSYSIKEEIYETEKSYETEKGYETEKRTHQAEKKENNSISPKSDFKVKTIQSSRISTEQLDKLMNLVGELIINRSRINELTINMRSKDLEIALSEFYNLTKELQDEIIEARMVPLDHITYIYPRMVRDLARAQNKKIDLIIKGKEIKLDRTILEEIGDSLVHLLRNAVDHGIETPEIRAELGKRETGTIIITASRQENFALIKIEDDGRGIDTSEILRAALKKGIISRESAEQLQENEVMQFIFAPGFSTSGTITDISGRGIGMDVVKNRVECLGGSVRVESKPGIGSRFELRLPLTIAVYQAMLIRVREERYAIPFTNIVKNIEISSQEIKHINGQEVILIDDKIIPLLRLRRVFQLPDEDKNKNNNFVILVERHGQHIGLIVDELLGKQEVIVKSFKSKLLENTRGFAGATILGDGNVILIIDVNALISNFDSWC
ncbi:two-component system, chemotaxis family, sensor kinase CheA [Methanosarcina thermophila]|uniref:Chemotaxis protein CheA n=3 Tax=Methanosarcina thermophila TaxID=2210 RepID=A0A1I6ZH35_METTE|nr:chemotaxis protein CheA [Methanosarcina thermophila]ALK04871.1 MAG: chemotaxis protein [Methanosarcina sp. 795]AKB13587.1 Signal transduction histidine kinase CheA [Methanosarcina thermophila TM-1]AKB15775.1 Signal transduction histidine kinase CheA [Methanosarcina thermophila CHTI-55]NLU56749.1 chemotaxis protein CheA [Methanosarcina thermophila]SFT62036.1 two-component system, chemotaxis family, sensor kinase CheA [Methanosarcina thermophila]